MPRDTSSPVFANNFIGRDDEVCQILDLLGSPRCRLITLAGSGGVGKTRLCLEIIPQVQALFKDGIFFIPLINLTTSNQILLALKENLQIQSHTKTELQTQILEYLDDKELLLILDDFENAIHDVELVAELIEKTKQLKILATSQEPLNLKEEWVRRIHGLTIPTGVSAAEVDLQNQTALQLFIERASQTGYQITSPDELDCAAQICHFVGGNPLAIELAASWLQFFSCTEIAARLNKNIDLLSTRMLNVPERHRSMRTVLNESWNLLSETEKDSLLLLSVFNASFRAETAEKVCGVDILTLSELVDKSLIQRTGRNQFKFHEMIRMYIQEKLAAQPQKQQEIEDSFCEYFANIVLVNEPLIKGSNQRKALDEMEAEFQNIQSAWFCTARRRDFNRIDKMLIGINHFCFMRGYASAYHEMLTAAIQQLAPTATEEPHRVWGKLLSRQDFSAYHEREALHQVQTSLAIARRDENIFETARGLLALGRIATEQGDTDQALSFFEESLELYERWGDLFYIAFLNSLIGREHLSRGSFDSASNYLNQSLFINQQAGNQRGEAYCLENIAVTYFGLGRFEEAFQNHLKANRIYQELDMRPALAYSEVKLGSYALFNGDFQDARRRCTNALNMAKKIHYADTVYFAQTMIGILECLENENYSLGKQLIFSPLRALSDSAFDFIVNWGNSLSAWGLGDLPASKLAIRKSLDRMMKTKNVPMILFCFPVCAAILMEESQYKQAAEMLIFAAEHPLSPNKWMEKAFFVRHLFSRLDELLPHRDMKPVWQTTKSLNIEPIVNSYLDWSSPAPFLKQRESQVFHEESSVHFSSKDLVESLTEREQEVLHLLSQGYSNRQIAAKLTIALGTAKTHIHNIYAKLAVSNRAQAIEKAKKLSINLKSPGVSEK